MKAKEYWIDVECTGDLCKGVYCHVYTTESRDAIHVIDYAAFEALKAQAETLARSLKQECCCTGELDYGNPPKPVLCDACEALSAYEAWKASQ